MKIIILSLLVLANNIHAQVTPAMIDKSVELKMDSFNVIGLGVAIIVDSSVAWSNAYGYADKENKKPYTLNTIQNIASISKTLLGVCIMRAVEENKLLLDEDINKYLPFTVVNPNHPEAKMTMRQLASHTSGINDHSPVYDSSYYYGDDAPQPLGNFLEDYFRPDGKYYNKENFLDVLPGARENYSNIGAALAGYIVECVTGKKLNEYSKAVIFKPLGMTNSGWFLGEIDINNHARLYKKISDSLQQVPLYGLTTYPDGGCRTSVNELSSFLVAVLRNGKGLNGRRILKQASVNEMLRFQYTTENKPGNVDLSYYNTGIFWEMQGEGAVLMGHHGADPGMRTFMFYNTSTHLGIVLFMNTQLPWAERERFNAIYDQLWEFAAQLKRDKSR